MWRDGSRATDKPWKERNLNYCTELKRLMEQLLNCTLSGLEPEPCHCCSCVWYTWYRAGRNSVSYSVKLNQGKCLATWRLKLRPPSSRSVSPTTLETTLLPLSTCTLYTELLPHPVSQLYFNTNAIWRNLPFPPRFKNVFWKRHSYAWYPPD